MLRRKLTADLVYASLGSAANKLLGFAIIAILARYVDKASMGEFFFAMSLASITAMLTELGTSKDLVRRISGTPAGAAEHLSRVLHLRVPLLALAFASINFCVWVVAPSLLGVFVLVSLHVLVSDLYFTFGATLIAVGSTVKRMATELVGPASLLAIVVPGTLLGWSFEQLLLAHVASSSVMVLIALYVTVRVVGRLPRWVAASSMWRVLRGSLPLFVLSALAVVHARLDEIMLAMFRSYDEVASYAAGYKLLEVSRVVVRPLSMVLFPVFVAAAAAASWRAYRDRARQLVLAFGGVGVTIAALAIPASFLAVPLIYGGEYRSSISLTQILFLTAPALFVTQGALLVANALYLDRTAIAVTAAGVVANAALNAVAIPRWGAAGAAWTTVLTETTVAVGLIMTVHAALRHRVDAGTRRPIAAAPQLDAGVS